MKLTSPTIIAGQARMNEQKQRRTHTKTFRAGGRTNRSTNGRLITKETHVNGQIGSSRNRTNERTKRSKWPLACTLKIRQRVQRRRRAVRNRERWTNKKNECSHESTNEPKGDAHEQIDLRTDNCARHAHERMKERTKQSKCHLACTLKTGYKTNGQIWERTNLLETHTNEQTNERARCLHAQNNERTDFRTQSYI